MSNIIGNAIFLAVDEAIRDQLLTSSLSQRFVVEETDDQRHVLNFIQNHANGIHVLLIGTKVEEPVRIAQCIYSVNKNVAILILSEVQRCESLRQVLKFSPFLGNHVIPWSSDQVSELSEKMLEVSRRIRKHLDYQSALSISQARLGQVYSDNSRQVTHYLGRVLDNAPIGVLNVDIRGCILGLNRYAANILGFTEREALGKGLTDIFSREETRNFQALISQCVAPARLPVPQIIDVSESNKSASYLEVVASSLADRSGQLGATLILRDVTARICAENERRVVEEALRISEHRYRELVRTMSEGLVLTDENQLISYVNDSFCEMFAYAQEDLLGMRLIDFVADASKREMQDSLCKKPDTGVRRFETTWLTSSGEQLETLTSQKRIIDPELGYVGCLGVLTDITERKLTESREKKHMLELAHMSRVTTMGELSSQVAHELAQPLAAIAGISTGCLKLFRSGNATDSEIEESLSDISGQAKRAREIVIRLRNFVRKEDVRSTRILINDLVKNVLHFIEVEARWYALKMQLDLYEQPLCIKGDLVLLEQVVLNLVHNAIEAMQSISEEKRRLALRTSLSTDQAVCISITDTGPGMTDSVKEKIFEPFYSTKSDGMGMGLAITRSIVKAHNGNVLVENNSTSAGVTFMVLLPLYPD